jgi:hypothetical protein
LGLQQVFEPSQVGGGLPLEQPGNQWPERPREPEQATLDHLGKACAGRAGRLDPAGARQLLLPVVGAPWSRRPASTWSMVASVRKGRPTSRSRSWVVTPTWAGPGTDGRIWVTAARQLGSLP